MATGKVANHDLQAEIIVNDSVKRMATADTEHNPPQWESWDGAYDGLITNINSVAVDSISQMHIHKYGHIVEINIVMTVKGMMLKGHPYTLLHIPYAPNYAMRAECYGAQSDADYADQKGVANITVGGNINFISYDEVASGTLKTFRFNSVFIAQ